MKKSLNEATRLSPLDILRFVAAFVVVLYHLTARPGGNFESLSAVTQYGYLGVPVFFMISGFVIALSTTNRSPFEFAVARIARLYPAFWICISATVIICYTFAGVEFRAYQLLTNVTLLNDYLGQPDIDGVYWTLHTELKFYACVFALMAFGVFHRFHVWLSIWLGLTLIHLLTGQPGFMGWFISPGWSPFFIVGVALYHIHAFKPGVFNCTVLVLSLAAALWRGYLIADGFMLDASASDKLVSVALVGISAGLLLLIALGKVNLPASRKVAVAGAMTYPLYLLHNAAGKAMIDGLTPLLPEGVAISVIIATMLYLSYVICQHLEPLLAMKVKTNLNLLPQLVSPLFIRFRLGKID